MTQAFQRSDCGLSTGAGLQFVILTDAVNALLTPLSGSFFVYKYWHDVTALLLLLLLLLLLRGLGKRYSSITRQNAGGPGFIIQIFIMFPTIKYVPY